jgi:hypothetical protein
MEPAHEEWRDILGMPRYQVSSLGQVRSCCSGDWRIMKATGHPKTGYLIVSLRVDGQYLARSVHRLVAASFLGEALGRDVNHKNGNKHDNRLDNLEYLSRGDNHRHAYRTGLRDPVGMKINREQRAAIIAMREVATPAAVAERFGVTTKTIARLRRRHRRASAPLPTSSIGV